MTSEINCVSAICHCAGPRSSALFISIIANVELDKSIFRQVDTSGDWSYLIEFGFGVILIVVVGGGGRDGRYRVARDYAIALTAAAIVAAAVCVSVFVSRSDKY